MLKHLFPAVVFCWDRTSFLYIYCGHFCNHGADPCLNQFVLLTLPVYRLLNVHEILLSTFATCLIDEDPEAHVDPGTHVSKGVLACAGVRIGFFRDFSILSRRLLGPGIVFC